MRISNCWILLVVLLLTMTVSCKTKSKTVTDQEVKENSSEANTPLSKKKEEKVSIKDGYLLPMPENVIVTMEGDDSFFYICMTTKEKYPHTGHKIVYYKATENNNIIVSITGVFMPPGGCAMTNQASSLFSLPKEDGEYTLTIVLNTKQAIAKIKIDGDKCTLVKTRQPDNIEIKESTITINKHKK